MNIIAIHILILGRTFLHIYKEISCYFFENLYLYHTAYSWNIMCQKWEGDCGLWVPNEIILKKYAESLKKIVGAVWELPAK